MAGIVWWEIETPQPELFQDFHTVLFGWDFESAFAGTELEEDYWIIQHDGKGIGGLQRADAGAATPSVGTRVYVEVDDLELVLGQVIDLGGTVDRARTRIGEDDEWFGIIRDPTGVSIGLWTPNPPGQE